MRHVILLDRTISRRDYEAWRLKDAAFWETFLGYQPDYWDTPYDFTDYPTYIDKAGHYRPTDTYLQELADDVHDSYHTDGTDFVMLLIRKDNWRSDPPGPGNGIWGTNYSNIFYDYHLQYNRWDHDNPTNSFNTLYHERLHAFDALVMTELGIDINPIVERWVRETYKGNRKVIDYLDRKGFRWDRDFVHGALPEVFDYIGRSGAGDNTRVLPVVMPYVTAALRKRRERHEDHTKGLQKNIIGLLEKLVRWLRKQKKHGVTT